MDRHTMVWRRLDTPGHDACRLARVPNGWRLEGTFAGQLRGAPAKLSYEVNCDDVWRSNSARVTGWIGARERPLTIERDIAAWKTLGALAQTPNPDLDACDDLDVGFSPSTNLIAIRRLDLKVGQAGRSLAAWLDIESFTITPLMQTYERRSVSDYWYESPTTGYQGLLRVDPQGFVLTYPRLWESET